MGEQRSNVEGFLMTEAGFDAKIKAFRGAFDLLLAMGFRMEGTTHLVLPLEKEISPAQLDAVLCLPELHEAHKREEREAAAKQKRREAAEKERILGRVKMDRREA